ncbi:unnamed protein product [Polarella glacialis]|uniref:Uncharacterized protein n=1 Tax=Polarella glacialis TaxID=89957 RepID=A0A813FT68_POLGL|nr:unnamed protein product [Polarella glacialis]
MGWFICGKKPFQGMSPAPLSLPPSAGEDAEAEREVEGVEVDRVLSIRVFPPDADSSPGGAEARFDEHPGAVASQLPFAAQMALLRGSSKSPNRTEKNVVPASRGGESPGASQARRDRQSTRTPERTSARSRRDAAGKTSSKKERSGPFDRTPVWLEDWEDETPPKVDLKTAQRQKARHEKAQASSKTGTKGFVYTRTHRVMQHADTLDSLDFHILTPEVSDAETEVEEVDDSPKRAAADGPHICAPFGNLGGLPLFIALTVGWTECWVESDRDSTQPSNCGAACFVPCEADKNGQRNSAVRTPCRSCSF